MINNADDIINLLESNDEFRNAVRRWVLTEELLGLPAVVRDLQGQVAARVGNVERQMLEMQGQIAELQRQVADLQAQMAEMQKQMVAMQSKMVEMNARLIRVEEDVAELKSDVKTLKDDVGALKGWQLQALLHGNGASEIGRRFDIRNPKILRAVGTGVNLQSFNNDLFDANKEGVLSDREYGRLLNTDMIMSGIDLGGAEIHVVAEASFALTSSDIEKVLNSADLLRRMYPESDVRTALWYVNVDDARRKAAEAEGVVLVRTQMKQV